MHILKNKLESDMISLFDGRSVERNHPDHPDEAVVLDAEGNPLYYASTSLTDAEILERCRHQDSRLGARSAVDRGEACDSRQKIGSNATKVAV